MILILYIASEQGQIIFGKILSAQHRKHLLPWLLLYFSAKFLLNIIFSHDFMHACSHGAEADNLGGQKFDYHRELELYWSSAESWENLFQLFRFYAYIYSSVAGVGRKFKM